jgi:hypothetical protein
MSDKSDKVKLELFEIEQMEKSADLYAEIYYEDKDLQELTDSAIHGWPE